MSNEQIKNNCINLIKKLDQQDSVVISLRKFVESYDGSDEESLQALCLAVVGVLLREGELKAKALGFDAISKVSSYSKDRQERLRQEWKDVKAGKLPEQPVVPSGAQ